MMKRIWVPDWRTGEQGGYNIPPQLNEKTFFDLSVMYTFENTFEKYIRRISLFLFRLYFVSDTACVGSWAIMEVRMLSTTAIVSWIFPNFNGYTVEVCE